MATSGCAIAQTQLGNGGMEDWENVTLGQEPVNWNSFMTAGGGLAGNADVQVEQSTDVPAGTSGSKSARIWSRNAGFSIVANGNLTLGKINMGSIIVSSIDNHNWTVTGDADFSEAITDTPDSIVFWAKFVPVSGGSEARMKATLHDNYDYQDPEDATSTSHVVATAELNYTQTNGWERIAVPFVYNGAASTVEYILVTFTTNKTAGGGDPDDQVWIDDVELIYNPASLDQKSAQTIEAFFNSNTNELNFLGINSSEGAYEVYGMNGALIDAGALRATVPFNAPTGIYIVNVRVGDSVKRFKVNNQ